MKCYAKELDSGCGYGILGVGALSLVITKTHDGLLCRGRPASGKTGELSQAIILVRAMKYREHKAGLSESMATVRDIAATKQAIIDASGHQFVTVAPYSYDTRIGWDTHIVTVEGYGVIGFTDGPITTTD